MNWAHVHLLLNHLPVPGTIFGAVLLGVALARRNDTLTKTSLVLFVLVAAIAVPTYLTGEPGAVVVLGVIGLAGLFASRRGKPLPRRLQVTALAVSLLTGGLMARTAQLGGQIHHEEIRASGTRSLDHPVNGPARVEESEH